MRHVNLKPGNDLRPIENGSQSDVSLGQHAPYRGRSHCCGSCRAGEEPSVAGPGAYRLRGVRFPSLLHSLTAGVLMVLTGWSSTRREASALLVTPRRAPGGGRRGARQGWRETATAASPVTDEGVLCRPGHLWACSSHRLAPGWLGPGTGPGRARAGAHELAASLATRRQCGVLSCCKAAPTASHMASTAPGSACPPAARRPPLTIIARADRQYTAPCGLGFGFQGSGFRIEGLERRVEG